MFWAIINSLKSMPEFSESSLSFPIEWKWIHYSQVFTHFRVVVQDTELVAYKEYFSYFDQLPVAQFQMLLPLVGMLCAVVGILAVIYLVSKKNRFLRASSFTALPKKHTRHRKRPKTMARIMPTMGKQILSSRKSRSKATVPLSVATLP